MTLAGVLGIPLPDLYHDGSEIALNYLERRWRELGSPTEPQALITFLERTLLFCDAQRLDYPQVFRAQLRHLQHAKPDPEVPF